MLATRKCLSKMLNVLEIFKCLDIWLGMLCLQPAKGWLSIQNHSPPLTSMRMAFVAPTIASTTRMTGSATESTACDIWQYYVTGTQSKQASGCRWTIHDWMIDERKDYASSCWETIQKLIMQILKDNSCTIPEKKFQPALLCRFVDYWPLERMAQRTSAHFAMKFAKSSIMTRFELQGISLRQSEYWIRHDAEAAYCN